jgi:L-rhamnose isomerase
MTCGPGLLLSAAPEIAADRRSRRWKLLASLHKVMLSPAYRYRSLDKALFSVAQDRFVIKESEFISGTVAEYQVSVGDT